MEKIKVEIDRDLEDLIPQFIENRKKDLIMMKELALAQDVAAIAALAHKIKGAAAGYGFQELSEMANAMETAAKQNNTGAFKGIADKMQEHFSRVDVVYVTM